MRTTSLDQAKLLFLGLLRTVSALATTEAKIGSYHHYHHHHHHHSNLGAPPFPLTLRLARRSDVAEIQRCNLATLPENYNQQFYTNHLRQWPDLAFVAVDESLQPTMFGTGFADQPQEKVVAYVLGKVEDRTVVDADFEDLYGRRPMYTTERLGHVTSLAVLEPYRRRGLAAELMKQLHHHLATAYQVSAVGLHVRQSNAAAERLYLGFGYEQAECIPAYYQDGEDAYFMRKRLEAPSMTRSPGLFGLRRSRPWETGPEDLRLPRRVGVPEEETHAEELLTGSM